jgi:hypothetical protein
MWSDDLRELVAGQLQAATCGSVTEGYLSVIPARDDTNRQPWRPRLHARSSSASTSGN